MAAISDVKTIGSTYSNEENVLKVRYDFSKDAGAAGALDLFVASKDTIITGFYAVVKTAFAGSGGSLAVGVTGATSAFVTATQGAVANLTANALLTANTVVTEGTPNTLAFSLPRRLAAGDKVVQTIGTGFTAGVIEYTIKFQTA